MRDAKLVCECGFRSLFCVARETGAPQSPFAMASVTLSADGIADIQRLRHRLAASQEETASLNQALEALSAAHKDISGKLLHLEEERDEARAQCVSLQQQLAGQAAMVSEARARADTAEAALRGLRTELAAASDARRDSSSGDVNTSSAASLSARAALAGAVSASSDVALQAQALQPLAGVLDDASGLVEALSTELRALRTEVAAQRSRGDELAALAQERGRQLVRLRGGPATSSDAAADVVGQQYNNAASWRSVAADSLGAVDADEAARSLAVASADAKKAAQKLQSGLSVLVSSATKCASDVEAAAAHLGPPTRRLM